MLFPWVGMLEQIRLADIFVHYDDVQFSKGGFTNRVQVKTPDGMRWLTVPLDGLKLGQSITKAAVLEKSAWRDNHIGLLQRSFAGAPFRDDALDLVHSVYDKPITGLGMLARRSMLAIADYYRLCDSTRFVDVSTLRIPGSGSQRVLDVVKAVGGTHYITGHGAKNYLEHDLFEEQGIRVLYMSYRRAPYRQLHGEFTPFVSSLDLIANCGQDGRRHICSNAVYWKDLLSESH